LLFADEDLGRVLEISPRSGAWKPYIETYGGPPRLLLNVSYITADIRAGASVPLLFPGDVTIIRGVRERA
jgi:hypothetical protein